MTRQADIRFVSNEEFYRTIERGFPTASELDHIERAARAQRLADEQRQQYRQQWTSRLTERVISAREDARARNFW